MAKLFISYNHKDALLVDTIARRLELEFGRNNIFYDAWSIQPGDSIVGKMNDGLADFDTFFLLLSPNSLASSMVGLEWRSALNRAVNNNLKFVVVRIADCNLPVILVDMLYIDLYGEGMDGSIEKMKRVAKLENCYTPLEDVQNCKVLFSVKDNSTAAFTIQALYFAEQNPQFVFISKNEFNRQSINVTSEITTTSASGTATYPDGTVYYAHRITLHRVLKPGFPFVVEFKDNDLSKLQEICVFVLCNAETGKYQPLAIERV